MERLEEILKEQEESLKEQEEILKEHTEILKKVEEKVKEHTEILKNHRMRIQRLEESSSSISSAFEPAMVAHEERANALIYYNADHIPGWEDS